MGCFTDSLRNFHKHFSKKYPLIFRGDNFLDNNKINNGEEEKEFYYKIPFEKPEVIPSISEAIDEALNLYINNLNNLNNLLNAINSEKFYSKKNVSVLFVLCEKERNVFDIGSIENLLYGK
jgi:hypothetical protein